MKDADLLTKIADRIQLLLVADEPPTSIVNLLIGSYGARTRFAGGTYHLTIADVSITNTAGGANLLNAWTHKARRVAAELAA